MYKKIITHVQIYYLLILLLNDILITVFVSNVFDGPN